MRDFKQIQNEPIRRLKSKYLNLCLSKRIVYDRGLTGATIEGAQQTGKSSYAMCVMSELFEGDVDKMFKHIVFNLDELTDLLQGALDRRERLICVLWDDCSVHGSASHYNTDRKLVQYLSGLGDVLGIATKGLLMTSPSGDLIKSFRSYNFYRVKIGFGKHEYDRIARGYSKGTSPYGQTYYSGEFTDYFDTRVPFYNRYYALREQYTVSALHNMRSLLDGRREEAHCKIVKDKKGRKFANIDIDE